MKTYLPLLYAALFIFLCCSNEQKTVETGNEPEAAISNTSGEIPSIIGQWKKIAYGNDDNKNGVLDENEKEKRPEAGSYENLNFYEGGRYMSNGILGEMSGPYAVKNYNGKRTIFLYTDDEEEMTQKERDESAARFEIRSLESGKLIVTPPIYITMLVVYTRVK